MVDDMGGGQRTLEGLLRDGALRRFRRIDDAAVEARHQVFVALKGARAAWKKQQVGWLITDARPEEQHRAGRSAAVQEDAVARERPGL